MPVEWIETIASVVIGAFLGAITTYLVQRRIYYEERRRALLDSLRAELEYNKRILEQGVADYREFRYGYRGRTEVERIAIYYEPALSVFLRMITEGLLLYLREELRERTIEVYQELQDYLKRLELLKRADAVYDRRHESYDFQQEYERLRNNLDELREELIRKLDDLLRLIGRD